MKSQRLCGILVAAVMCATAAFAYVARPTIHLSDEIGRPDLEALFPTAFLDWRVDSNGSVVLPAPDVQAKLNKIYNQVLSRIYINSVGERIMLSVAYGGDQSDGTRAHRPEVCYPAQGFQINSNRTAELRMVDRSVLARTLMSELGARKEPITYWIVVGSEVATTGIEQKLAQMRYGFRGVIPDGMLIRVSSIDGNMFHGHKLQARFLFDLSQSIRTEDRSRVFGHLSP